MLLRIRRNSTEFLGSRSKIGRNDIAVEVSHSVERDGFVFADLTMAGL